MTHYWHKLEIHFHIQEKFETSHSSYHEIWNCHEAKINHFFLYKKLRENARTQKVHFYASVYITLQLYLGRKKVFDRIPLELFQLMQFNRKYFRKNRQFLSLTAKWFLCITSCLEAFSQFIIHWYSSNLA